MTEGCAVAFCAHTTCALVVNEWEDGALDDLAQRLETLVPEEATTRTTTSSAEPRTSRKGTSGRTASPMSRR